MTASYSPGRSSTNTTNELGVVGSATSADVGAPGFRLGYVDLRVDPEAKRLGVQIIETTPEAFNAELVSRYLQIKQRDML